MKYFFLTEGWTYHRVWQTGGLWDTVTWRRPPHVQQLKIGIEENGEILWLYEVEEAVLMVEVKPLHSQSDNHNIGQVVLKRLMNSHQVIDTLVKAKRVVNENS